MRHELGVHEITEQNRAEDQDQDRRQLLFSHKLLMLNDPSTLVPGETDTHCTRDNTHQAHSLFCDTSRNMM